jgi:hypothetical protein
VVLSFSALLIDALARQEAMLLPGQAGKRRGRAASQTSVHQRWLAALKAPSGSLPGDPAELVKLTYQIKEWRRLVYTLAAAPYRFCFRLEEPDPVGFETDDETWVVRYLLQAKADPSLLIPVPDAWKGRVKPKITGENLAARREFILTALGQAACFSPQIEESIKSGIPAGCSLDSNAAFEFLCNQAPWLKQAGFAVMLPSWWTSQGSRARLSVTGRAVSSPFSAGGGLGLDDVVSFDWQVALGDEVLTAEELEALARLKSPLVKLRGQWVEVDAGEIKAALNFWQKKASQQLTARDVVRLSLGVATQPQSLPSAKCYCFRLVSKCTEAASRKGTGPRATLAAGITGTAAPVPVAGLYLAQLSQ